MKVFKLPCIVLILSFACGFGLCLTLPATSSAGNNPCNNNCYMDYSCGGHAPGAPLSGTYNCPYGYVATFRCYAWAMLVCDPELMSPYDFNCRCVQTGCTIPC